MEAFHFGAKFPYAFAAVAMPSHGHPVLRSAFRTGPSDQFVCLLLRLSPFHCLKERSCAPVKLSGLFIQVTYLFGCSYSRYCEGRIMSIPPLSSGCMLMVSVMLQFGALSHCLAVLSPLVRTSCMG